MKRLLWVVVGLGLMIGLGTSCTKSPWVVLQASIDAGLPQGAAVHVYDVGSGALRCVAKTCIEEGAEGMGFQVAVRVPQKGLYAISIPECQIFRILVMHNTPLQVRITKEAAHVVPQVLVIGDQENKHINALHERATVYAAASCRRKAQFQEARDRGRTARARALYKLYCQEEKAYQDALCAQIEDMQGSLAVLYGVGYLFGVRHAAFVYKHLDILQAQYPYIRRIARTRKLLDRLVEKSMVQGGD